MSQKFKQTTIGILTVPLSKSKKKKADVVSSYIPDSYVKWIESSGARVVPIPFNWTEKKIRNALDQVNGVLFPGGDVDRTKNDDFKEYIDTFKYIFNYAKRRKHFPLWATCLGFEFLVLMPNYTAKQIFEGYRDGTLIDTVRGRHQAVPLELTNKNKSFLASRKFFNRFTPADGKWFKNDAIYMNHGYGFIATEERVKELEKYMHVLSTNTDLNHIEYVSTVEFKKHPFFGTQWHPEKVQFEWQDDSIPHDDVAQFISKKVSQMFVDQAQKNPHVLKDDSLLIYHYNLHGRQAVLDVIDPRHAKDKKNHSVFEQSYYFKRADGSSH